jgi:hypothetical protein
MTVSVFDDKSKQPTSSEILSAIENAREYAEGRSICFDVTTTEDVVTVKQLIAIKMNY